MTDDTLLMFRDKLLNDVGLAHKPAKAKVKVEDDKRPSGLSAVDAMQDVKTGDVDAKVKQEELESMWESSVNGGKILVEYGVSIGKVGALVRPEKIEKDQEDDMKVAEQPEPPKPKAHEKVDIRLVGKDVKEYRYMSDQVLTDSYGKTFEYTSLSSEWMD